MGRWWGGDRANLILSKGKANNRRKGRQSLLRKCFRIGFLIRRSWSMILRCVTSCWAICTRPEKHFISIKDLGGQFLINSKIHNPTNNQ
jgi:hypothetical protein